MHEKQEQSKKNSRNHVCELHLLQTCPCPKPWSSGWVLEVLIGWFVCVAGAYETRLGTCVDGCVCGSQPVRAGVGAGKALTASRLPARHQNRWMPLIVTVCNVLNSIIPGLSRFHTTSLSLLNTGALCTESERTCIYTADLVLFITPGELPHLLQSAATVIKSSQLLHCWAERFLLPFKVRGDDQLLLVWSCRL